MTEQRYGFIIFVLIGSWLVVGNVFGQPFPDKPAIRLGKGEIRDIAYSPDGEILAVAGSQLWLYNANNLEEIIQLTGHIDRVTDVEFSPDGRLLASTSNDFTVRLWDMTSHKSVGQLIHQPLVHQSGVTSIAFSPNGELLASALDNSIVLWSIPNLQELGQLEGHFDTINDLVFSLDGKLLVSGSDDSTVRLWDIETRQEAGRMLHFTELLFSLDSELAGELPVDGVIPEGLRLAFEDNGVRLAAQTDVHFVESFGWFIDEYTLRLSADNAKIYVYGGEPGGEPGYVTSVAIHPDGTKVASAGGMHPAGIILWDVATQEQITTFEFHYGKSLVAFSPDGNLLASEGGFPDSFHIWEVSTHQQIAALDTREFGGSSGARQMIFSPDGEIIAIATNRTVQFWEVAAQKKIRSLDYSGAVTFLAFGANSNALVSAGGLSLDRSRIQFWNILRNRQSARLGSYGPITVSADGKVLAWQRQGIIPDTGVIQFWDTETQQQVAQVEIPLESLFSPGVPFALNTDGSLLAIATRLPDSPLPTIELWDVPRQQILSKFEIGSINGSYADSVVFSPDGSLLAVEGSNGIELWDVQTQALVGELVSGLVRYGLSAHGIVFSPDGEMLAIPAENQKIELWDVASQQQFGQLESATPPFGFTPDGKYLVASGNTVYPPPINFWDVQPHQLVGSLQGEGDTVASLALSLDGRWLAVGDSVGTIDLWQLNLSLGLVAVEPKGKQFIMLGEIKRTGLLQNYPNPFNPETWIPFILAEAADVEIAIYDINGQLVRWLMLGHREAGVYQNRNQAAYWDGKNNVGESVSSGGYFIELRTGEETFVRKAMLLK